MLDATVELSGMAPGNDSLELFASRDGDDGGPGRLTRYRIGTEVRDLDAQDNTGRIATFDSLSPDAGGSITLHVGVSPAGTARFAYIGSLIPLRQP